MAAEEVESTSIHIYHSKIRELSAYEHESAVTPPKSLTTTVVERRHKYESPSDALRRREARRVVKSSPHVTPDGIVSPTSVDVPFFDSELESKIDSPDYRESGLRKLKTKSWESVQRWKKENEFLDAMIQDEAQWLHNLFPEEPVAAEFFFQALEDGVILCKLAQLCQNYAEDLAKKENIRVPEFSIKIHPRQRCRGPMGQFMRRENVELFLNWCRAYRIPEPILFESNDVVEQSEEEGLREGAREIVLCLMEVARLGVKFGVRPPQLILLEHEIDQEEKMDSMLADGSLNPPSMDSAVDTEIPNEEVKNLLGANLASGRSDCRTSSQQSGRDADCIESKSDADGSLDGSDKSQPADRNQGRKSSQVSKSELHERVQMLFEEYNIQKFTRLREGKYIILGKVMFVRMLNGHVIVRVGGGWDGLEHYLMTHVGVAASSATAEQRKSPLSFANKVPSSISPSNLLQSKLKGPTYASSSPHIHLHGSGQAPVSTGSSSSDSSRCSSPALSVKDRLGQDEMRRKQDERKLSEAIMKVQAETYSKLIKAASLADLTSSENSAKVELPTARKYSAYEPLIKYQTRPSKESSLPTSNTNLVSSSLSPNGNLERRSPSPNGNLERRSPSPSSNLERRSQSPSKYEGEHGVVEATNTLELLDPEFGLMEKTVSVTRTSKSSSTARTKTTTITTVTTTKETSRSSNKPATVSATEKRAHANRVGNVRVGTPSSVNSEAALPANGLSDSATATGNDRALQGSAHSASTTKSTRKPKQNQAVSGKKSSSSSKPDGASKRESSGVLKEGKVATSGRQLKDPDASQVGTTGPARVASAAGSVTRTAGQAGGKTVKEKSLTVADSVGKDFSRLKPASSSKMAGTKIKSASAMDLSRRSDTHSSSGGVKSKSSSTRDDSSVNKTALSSRKKAPTKTEKEVKKSLAKKTGNVAEFAPGNAALAEHISTGGSVNALELGTSDEICALEANQGVLSTQPVNPVVSIVIDHVQVLERQSSSDVSSLEKRDVPESLLGPAVVESFHVEPTKLETSVENSATFETETGETDFVNETRAAHDSCVSEARPRNDGETSNNYVAEMVTPLLEDTTQQTESVETGVVTS